MSHGSTPSAAAQSTPVGFLELFYDLVFVAATMVLSNEFTRDPTWKSAGLCALMFVLLWLLWFHTTVLMNVDRRDDLTQRGLMFVQMFVIFVITLEFVDRTETDPDFVGLGYMVGVFVLAFAYHRVRNRPGGTGNWAKGRRNRLLLAGLAMIVAFAIPDGIDFLVWALAIMLLVVPTSAAHSRGLPVEAIDEHHLLERAALLTLIVMGEAFVKVALVVSAGALTSTDIVSIAVMFIVLFSLFAVYFDDIPKAGIHPGILAGESWLLAHLVMQLGIVALAIGMSKYIQVENGHVHDVAIIVLAAAFVGIFGGLTVIGLLGMREPKRGLFILRVVTVALALGGGFVAWNVTAVSAQLYVGFLAALAVVHTVIDELIQPRTRVVAHGAGVGDDPLNIRLEPISGGRRDVI